MEPNFKRVDFDNFESILEYGHEVVELTKDILDKVIENEVNYQELEINKDMVEEITTFYKLVTTTNSKRKIFSFLRKKEENKNNSYQDRFNKYIDILEKTREIIEQQKKVVILDFRNRRQLIELLPNSIELLEQIIKVGTLDKEQYEEKLISMPENEYVKNQKMLTKFFEQRLESLNKVLISYKECYKDYLIEQKNELHILTSCTEYLNNSLIILYSQVVRMKIGQIDALRNKALTSLTLEGNSILKTLTDKNTNDTELQINYYNSKLDEYLSDCLKEYTEFITQKKQLITNNIATRKIVYDITQPKTKKLVYNEEA